jgi:hypothetical protein
MVGRLAEAAAKLRSFPKKRLLGWGNMISFGGASFR